MRKTTFALSIVLASVTLGCTVRNVVTSVPPRIFREVHGLRVRSYEISPVTDDLRCYRAIEIRPLENLMLDQIPESSVAQLNTQIAKGLRSLKSFERTTSVDELATLRADQIDQSVPDVREDVSQPELILEGHIDDYTPGIPKLRYIEQGNNHAVLTVRIRLKNKQSAKVLGEINITVENTRITSNVARMVEKTADEVVSYVERNTTRYKGATEVTVHAQQ